MSISSLIAHQNNLHPDFTVRALFANLLTQNLLNPCHSLANNPPLLLNPTMINTLKQKKVKILSPIGYLPMLMVNDDILEVLPYKLPIS